MTIVQPYPARFTIQDDAAMLRIELPARRGWFFSIFLGFWLVAWFIGEIFGLAMLVMVVASGSSGFSETPAAGWIGGIFVAVWIIIWTVVGVAIAFGWLTLTTGKEIIQVSRQDITIGRSIFGFSRPRIYMAQYIVDLRLQPILVVPWRRYGIGSAWRQRFGSLAFDYGARTVTFANGADPAEAKQIMAAIGNKLGRQVSMEARTP